MFELPRSSLGLWDPHRRSRTGLRGPMGDEGHLSATQIFGTLSSKEKDAISRLNGACLDPGPAHRFAGKVLGGGAAAATEQGLCPPLPKPPLTLRDLAPSRPQARKHWRRFCRPQGAHRTPRGSVRPTRLSHWDLNLLSLPRLPCLLASLQLAILILDVQPDSACSSGLAFGRIPAWPPCTSQGGHSPSLGAKLTQDTPGLGGLSWAELCPPKSHMLKA